MRQELHWIAQCPTPYNHHLFEAICSGGFDLTVHYVSDASSQHPWKEGFHGGYRTRSLKTIFGIDPLLLWLVIRRAVVICGGWNNASLMLLLSLGAIMRCPVFVWTDTPNLKRKRGFIKARLRRWWLRWSLKRIAAVLGTGRPALQALRDMGCDESRLHNFPYYVDVNLFKPKSDGNSVETSQHLLIISSGRLANNLKGHDLALKAIARLRATRPDVFELIRYRIAGDGPDRETLRSLAVTLGIADRIDLLGWVEPSVLPSFYRSGFALLHPSRWDPYGNAVLEGMSAGLVVLGSDSTGAVLDRIEHMKNGLVHPAGDIDCIATQIAYVALHRRECLEIGRRARRTALEWPASRAVVDLTAILKSSQAIALARETH